MSAPIPAAAAGAKAAGLSWQTVALILATGTASTGGSLVVHRATGDGSRTAEVELEQRVHALEEAQHRSEVAQAARDAHLDEQLAVIRDAVAGMRADLRALAQAKGNGR